MKRVLISSVLFLALRTIHAQPLVIPQIADGGGWQTTIVITNTTTSATNVSVSFFEETGAGATAAWNLAVLEAASTQNVPLPAAGTLFLHTPATAANTSVGWAQVQAGAGVVAYAVFTTRSGGSQNDGTAPAVSAGGRILIPFDNTSGNVTSIAIANPSGTAESISAGIQLVSGAISQLSPVMLPAQGHTAFALPQQFPSTAGQSGLLELYAASGSLTAIALRFDPTGAFTSAPVYPETGAPIIGGSSQGGAPLFNQLQLSVTYQPSQSASFQTTIIITPNAAAGTYSAELLGGGELINGTASNDGQTFTFGAAQPGGSFLIPGADILLTLASGSMTVTLTETGTAAGFAQGNVTGTLTVSGSAAGSNAPYTFSGPIVGTYLEQLVTH